MAGGGHGYLVGRSLVCNYHPSSVLVFAIALIRIVLVKLSPRPLFGSLA